MKKHYVTATIYMLKTLALVAQLDRAFGYEPKGRVFESLRGHQLNVQEAVADATASFFVPYHLIQKL